LCTRKTVRTLKPCIRYFLRCEFYLAVKKLSVIAGILRDVDEICGHFAKGYDETSTRNWFSTLRNIAEERRSRAARRSRYVYNIAGTDVLFLVIVVDFVVINDPESVRTAVEWQPCSCYHSNQTRLPIIV